MFLVIYLHYFGAVFTKLVLNVVYLLVAQITNKHNWISMMILAINPECGGLAFNIN